MAKRCPACNLVNPDAAEICDCGRSFVDGAQGLSLERRIGDRLAARNRLRNGAVALLSGSALAGIVAAQLGPWTPLGFVLAFAVAAGGLAISGIVQLIRWRQAEDEG